MSAFQKRGRVFKGILGDFLWLRFHASTSGDMGSIPSQGTQILHAEQRGQINK